MKFWCFLLLIFVNVDNISGEIASYITESIMKKGAKNVHIIPALTKKGRPEFIFLIDVEGKENTKTVIGFLAAELGTLGLRILKTKHIKLSYTIEKVDITISDIDANVGVKIVKDKNGKILTANAEFRDLEKVTEDLAKANIHIPLMKLKEIVESAFLSRNFKIKIKDI
jgi:uncharacterized protein (DUF111 family)